MWTSIELDVECIVCNKTLQKFKKDLKQPLKMRRITKSRSRTPNWSHEEKQYLLDLIKERKDVVVIKPNSPNHYEEKDIAWNEILHELTVKFGSKFTGFSIKKLKTQWQNMKRIAREEISLNGSAVQNYTRQSVEVCNILDLVKDGVLKTENANNESVLKTNVEIKTECIDEEINEPSCSNVNFSEKIPPNTNHVNTIDSSSSSLSENTYRMDVTPDVPEETETERQKNTETMTNLSNTFDFHLLPREFYNFIRFSTSEKELKMESLKEERQIVRAMRETAELNKIIAEQKLKHVLWLKKKEMA